MEINIGIIGGMGPKATNQFLDRITELTDAANDQEHVRYILYSDPAIPDRIGAYFNGAKSPVEAINKGIDFLEKNGITTIAIPCNTAHIWFSEFKTGVNLLNMVDLTVKAILKSGYKHPGFLATTATIKSGLYIKNLEDAGITTIIPEQEDTVMEAVKLVKLGEISRAKAMLKPVVKELEDNGSDSIIMACTEIPVILNKEDTELPLIDSDRILAEKIILSAGKRLKLYNK